MPPRDPHQSCPWKLTSPSCDLLGSDGTKYNLVPYVTQYCFRTGDHASGSDFGRILFGIIQTISSNTKILLVSGRKSLRLAYIQLALVKCMSMLGRVRAKFNKILVVYRILVDLRCVIFYKVPYLLENLSRARRAQARTQGWGLQ